MASRQVVYFFFVFYSFWKQYLLLIIFYLSKYNRFYIHVKEEDTVYNVTHIPKQKNNNHHHHPNTTTPCYGTLCRTGTLCRNFVNLRQSLPRWSVYFVAYCIATKCASIAAFPGAHFVASRSCTEIKYGRRKKTPLSVVDPVIEVRGGGTIWGRGSGGHPEAPGWSPGGATDSEALGSSCIYKF
jgi:hypothetical protein